MNKRFDEDIWIIERLALSLDYDLYLALWPEVGEKVLIKHVSSQLSDEKKEKVENRLLKEAATLEEFWSPFFPKIYDIRRKDSDQSLYIISQYFEGITLSEFFKLHAESGLSKEFSRKLEEDLNFALNYLHQKKGVTHLDLSPDNIIVSPDMSIRLIDFENSKLIGEPLTRCELRGKEKYMAPELKGDFDSLIIKPDFDRYSLKIILNEAKSLQKKKFPIKMTAIASAISIISIFLFIGGENRKVSRSPAIPKEVKRELERKPISKDKIRFKAAALERKPKKIEQKLSFEDEFNKQLATRENEILECLKLFEPAKTKINLSFEIYKDNGHDTKISLQDSNRYREETKICLSSLLKGMKFQPHPTQRRIKRVRTFGGR